MKGKFTSFDNFMGLISTGLEKQKSDLEWYKFKVKQISARFAAKPI